MQCITLSSSDFKQDFFEVTTIYYYLISGHYSYSEDKDAAYSIRNINLQA
jgi:hypothetical protein